MSDGSAANAMGDLPAGAPQHVAVIMDGNGRWAVSRGMPRVMGHRKGVDVVRPIVEAAADMGIAHLTLFAFSAENWQRPRTEVEELMRLLKFYLRSQIAELHRNGVKLRVIGEREGLSSEINALIDNAEAVTRGNTRISLSVALNYGGRQDIVRATRNLARRVADGELACEAIDEAAVSAALYTHGTPDPDLLIRTSGEQRMSNFLLWQFAYTEMVFLETLWPDFTPDHLRAAVEEFHRRDRRFGATVSAG